MKKNLQNIIINGLLKTIISYKNSQPNKINTNIINIRNLIDQVEEAKAQ